MSQQEGKRETKSNELTAPSRPTLSSLSTLTPKLPITVIQTLLPNVLSPTLILPKLPTSLTQIYQLPSTLFLPNIPPQIISPQNQMIMSLIKMIASLMKMIAISLIINLMMMILNLTSLPEGWLSTTIPKYLDHQTVPNGLNPPRSSMSPYKYHQAL